MLLELNGITRDIKDNNEINRLKALGYKEVVIAVEEKPLEIPQIEESKPDEKPVKKPTRKAVKDVPGN